MYGFLLRALFLLTSWVSALRFSHLGVIAHLISGVMNINITRSDKLDCSHSCPEQKWFQSHLNLAQTATGSID